jgi:hypothetical protein
MNTGTQSQYTLNTSENCSLDASVATPGAVSNHIVDTACASSGANNDGGALSTVTLSLGEGFNQSGGDVYAHLWDGTGIKARHFARNEVPEDITDGTPDPTSWDTPAAFWSARLCDMVSHFYDHVLAFDTTSEVTGPVRSIRALDAEEPAPKLANPSNFDNAQWKPPCTTTRRLYHVHSL